MALNRDQIITAAIRHLNADPTASMAEIADGIGVSRATLHRHFSSREALFADMGRRALDVWARAHRVAGVEEAIADGSAERLEAALRRYVSELITQSEEFGFALTDSLIAVLPELQAYSRELEDRDEALAAAAQRAGVLRPDVPPRWVGNAVYGLLISVRDSLRNGDIAARDAERLLLETVLHGLAAPAKERP
ncbi:AcrR family transcriptional regulator [Thermocatellispora tengchongensis]|uniref:AcrR family transcriptional regulator n=1 Tax=Thermocatellispora tengchongensis TaxID=1073253 RepID=A0A840NYG9_9ACTN|nr:TetR/AcrR family transcriptional regulator [Thermocatellispora tengchongensis]MBB5131256.1 AcrR family transcriptional regulator [Thermocatellispora tengchongensis]